MALATKLPVSDILHIAVSEIAYYRYLLPESFFLKDWFDGIQVRRIRPGQSDESDGLLDLLKGASECLSRGHLRSLAIGLSVHPDDPLYIRELYAFRFEPAVSSDHRRGSCVGELLHRLVPLLRAMEMISAPIHVCTRLVLAHGAPAGYVPPSFVPLVSGVAGQFTIMPQFGSAQVGAVDGGGAAVQLCVLSVEGPVQVPPLGSAKSPAAVQLNIDDSQAQVFAGVPCIASRPAQNAVAHAKLARLPATAAVDPGRRSHRPSRACRAPSAGARASSAYAPDCDCRLVGDEETRTCYRCKRKCHSRCYALGDDAARSPLVCVTCQADAAGASPSVIAVGRLLIARRTAAALCALGKGRVFSVLDDIGCRGYRGQGAMVTLQKLGVVSVDKSMHPHGFHVSPDGQRAAQATLFCGDVCAELAAVGHASPPTGSSAPAPRPAAA